MTNLFHVHGSHLRQSAMDCERAARVRDDRACKRRETTIFVVMVALLLPVAIELAQAGGPQYVAGVSFFDAGLAGKPVTWAGGTIRYYTDQGNLSSTVATAAADAFVADAFSRWTSVPTAAVSATRAGQLAEDVNGTNVIFVL